MEKQMFEDIKIGDRVWSYIHQRWFTVTEVRHKIFGVGTGEDFCYWINKDGTHVGFKGGAPTWFWDEIPLIVPPPRPRRKVQKTCRIFVNLYPLGSCFPVYAHSDETEARKVAKSYAIAVAVPVDVPYEVEE